MHLVKYIIIYFIFYFNNLTANENDFNPYETLGLSRTASDKEIRQAYKKSAKYWHPDKNSEPNAHDQFTKINAAYEILSDSTKRQNYDKYGTTSQDNHHGFDTNHFRDPFDMFRAHFFQETSSSAKKIIHSHDFLKNILPNSDKKPYLIFGSTNFCFHCRQPLEIFRSMEKQLNDVGIGTGEFNINDENLSSELGIINVPSLCAISQGRVYHFDDQDFSETNIKEFIRKSIPIKRFIKILYNYNEILTLITSYNQSNRVHALLITKQKKMTLKFVIPCLQYSARIQCAMFNSSMIKIDQLPSFLKQVSTTSDTILLFKENINQPDIVIKDSDFNFNYIQKIFESNQLLHLPTITSAIVFDLVCQINSANPCFLIIGDTNLFSRYHSIFLRLSQEFKSPMAYLDLSSTKQVEFNKILSSYYNNNEKKLLILVARRWGNDKIEIQNTNIESDEKSLNDFQHNKISIEENLKLFLTIQWKNAKKYTLPIIFNFDERNQNIFIKITDQFQNKWNYWIERNRLLRYLSGYLYTYQFWTITIFIFFYMYISREEPDKRKINSKKINKMKIYEFNESLLQYYTNPRAPNVIILLLIADTPKDLCVKNFKQEINSIKKDSRLIFSILYRQQSLNWLDELLNNIEDNKKKQSIQIFPSTILALYIRRKFFVSHCSISSNNNNNQLTSKLTFSDWIDLLFDGNFRQPISITEWPMKFH